MIQYTIAIDRVNDEVNYLYNPLHPAVLRLVSMTIEAGNRANIPVSMCGEMASDIRYTKLLLAMGLRELSVHPSMILEVRKVITETNVDQIQPALGELLKDYSHTGSQSALENLLAEI